MSKRKAGPGRKPLPPGKKKERCTVNLDQDIIRWLKKMNNYSGFVNKNLREIMMQQPIETTIGAIADHWSSEPSEWGLLGTVEIVEDRKTSAKFERSEDGSWQLWVLYPDGQWDSPSQRRWRNDDVQGLRQES